MIHDSGCKRSLLLAWENLMTLTCTSSLLSLNHSKHKRHVIEGTFSLFSCFYLDKKISNNQWTSHHFQRHKHPITQKRNFFYQQKKNMKSWKLNQFNKVIKNVGNNENFWVEKNNKMFIEINGISFSFLQHLILFFLQNLTKVMIFALSFQNKVPSLISISKRELELFQLNYFLSAWNMTL